MELRVLMAVVEVGGVPEVAEALGIAGTTVKTHLGAVYKKTNRSRLVKLIS
jgi:DNA-binding CsgD family transcriptional regulator